MPKLTLLGEVRSTNHIYKYHCKFGFPSGYMSAEGKSLKEDYQWQAKSQWKGGVNEQPLSVVVKIFFKSKIKHDIDNYSKILFDSLTGIVWKDDSQIEKLTISKHMDKSSPRIELEIFPI
jgi:Holliday junction resolvase RusA-like endonuclease